MGEDFTTPLEPMGWYWERHLPVVHIGGPPPAATLTALAELAKSRHKRSYGVTRVLFCWRVLWQEEWRHSFEHEIDLLFMLHTGTVWPHRYFEPMFVGIYFPVSRTRPCLVRQFR